MSSNPPFLPVSTATVSWVDNQQSLHLHVYACDGYTVTEQVIGGGAAGWSAGNFSQSASFVSATAWVLGGSASIRVYCTNEDTTTEWCCDNADTGTNNWYQGQYTTGG